MYYDLKNLECLPNVKRASYQRRQFRRSPTGGGTEGFAVKFYIRYLRFVFVVIPKRFKNSSHLLLSENKHGRTDGQTDRPTYKRLVGNAMVQNRGLHENCLQ